MIMFEYETIYSSPFQKKKLYIRLFKNIIINMVCNTIRPQKFMCQNIKISTKIQMSLAFYIHTYIHIHTYTYIHIYIYIYIYILHTHTRESLIKFDFCFV